MDLIALLRLTLRRWIVVVPVLILTALAGLAMISNRSSTFEVSGAEILVSEPDESAVSPLPADVAAENLTDLLLQPAVRSQIAAEGLSTTYSTSVSLTGATVRLVVTADTAELATQTASYLVNLAPTLLAESAGEALAKTVAIRPLTPPSVSNAIANTSGGFGITSSIVITENPVAAVNPFPTSAGTVSLLLQVAASNGLKLEIEAIDPTAIYTATTDTRDAPIFALDVTAATSELATAVYDRVLQRMVGELDRMQDESHVTEQMRTHTRTLVAPDSPTQTVSSLVRPLAGVVILGGGLATGLAVLVESIVAGRRQRHREWDEWTRREQDHRNSAQ